MVVIRGDIRTSGNNNPLDFRGDDSNLRAGLRLTAPIDQIAERNAYRTALVNYQRAKRDYIAAEDGVKQQIRRSWRQLAVLSSNLETSRQSVRFAAMQLDSAIEEVGAPAQGNQINTTGIGIQGRNLLQALGDVLSAQNSLISNYINYEQNRLSIYRDMGMMLIDEDGVWNDPVYRDGVSEGMDASDNFDRDGMELDDLELNRLDETCPRPATFV